MANWRRALVVVVSLGVGALAVLAVGHNRRPMPLAIGHSLTISGLVVPHHDLVASQRAAFLAQAAAKMKQPPAIILVSPNHYEVGKGNIQTADQAWEVTAGTIASDSRVIASLSNASLEPGSFANEHGIKNLLADIKKNFPTAKLVPLILKRATTAKEIADISAALDKSCPDCLMIASVDFSHYQPSLLAELHDNLSQRVLENLDEPFLLARSETDSPASLAMLVEWAKLRQTSRFTTVNRTDSGVLDGQIDREGTSHLYGWYEQGSRRQPATSLSFSLAGDMMFGRSIAHNFLEAGLSTSVDGLGERLFWGTDAGVVNLEGPVSPTLVPDDIRPDYLIFNFPPEAIGVLRYLHINGASQANNHSFNQGQAALDTTRQLLKTANIQPIGDPNGAGADYVGSFTGQRLTLKIIGAHTLETIPDIIPLIRSLKADSKNRVLIFPHWGTEYATVHSPSQAAQAHAWIDAGADIVIGAHPHVVQDMEVYAARPIFYSMGNLLFDQAFSPEVQQGLVVNGEFTNNGLRVFVLPTQSTNYKPQVVLNSSVKQARLDALYGPAKAYLKTSPAGQYLFFPKP